LKVLVKTKWESMLKPKFNSFTEYLKLLLEELSTEKLDHELEESVD